eukprot:CAMPEP_0114550002 /NCGR_PEP_ID=MMETSP0114-20121206/5831_1 /TAXON_ID=31324 /ORGANISM="Goniomonas sp, Strain m" /LENGTH=105 /DNA_ID=CAMNT_0001734727 /DNA_START=296 /DNA_END=614 /DNA_ORIENTATION=-
MAEEECESHLAASHRLVEKLADSGSVVVAWGGVPVEKDKSSGAGRGVKPIPSPDGRGVKSSSGSGRGVKPDGKSAMESFARELKPVPGRAKLEPKSEASALERGV